MDGGSEATSMCAPRMSATSHLYREAGCVFGGLPACGSNDVLQHGCIHRLWREVPIGPKPVVIQMGIPRVECRKCATIRQIGVGFADERRSYTRAFARYALGLSRYMTIQDVARHLNVGWDLIKEIQKSYLQKHFSRPKLSKLSQIAIDEISIGKGPKYLTVLLTSLPGGGLCR